MCVVDRALEVHWTVSCVIEDRAVVRGQNLKDFWIELQVERVIVQVFQGIQAFHADGYGKRLAYLLSAGSWAYG